MIRSVEAVLFVSRFRLVFACICMFRRRYVYLTCYQIGTASYCRVSPRIDVYFVVSTLTSGKGAQAASHGKIHIGKIHMYSHMCMHMYRRLVSSAHQERCIDMYRRVQYRVRIRNDHVLINLYRACIEKVKFCVHVFACTGPARRMQ